MRGPLLKRAAMITASVHPRQLESRTWQQDLAEAITSPEELAAALGLDPRTVAGAHAASHPFRLRVPRSFVARMRRGDLEDPLLRQVLPVTAELTDESEYVADPVGERAALRALVGNREVCRTPHPVEDMEVVGEHPCVEQAL